MRKPILVLDFDGVCHSYQSPWTNVTTIPDPPVPGMFDFLTEAARHFDLQVLSARSQADKGIEAMQDWFVKHYLIWKGWPDQYDYRGYAWTDVSLLLKFPKEKPMAFLSIDDRALCFQGTWPTPAELLKFKPWNK
jgi:hypothetical protein